MSVNKKTLMGRLLAGWATIASGLGLAGHAAASVQNDTQPTANIEARVAAVREVLSQRRELTPDLEAPATTLQWGNWPNWNNWSNWNNWRNWNNY